MSLYSVGCLSVGAFQRTGILAHSVLTAGGSEYLVLVVSAEGVYTRVGSTLQSYKSPNPRRKAEMKVDGSRCHRMLHYGYKVFELGT